MDSSIPSLYQLDQCADWIIANKYRRIIIQIKKNSLVHSSEITNYLKSRCTWETLRTSERVSHEETSFLDIYITQPSTCSVDLLVSQHISNLDAIIYLGDVCLVKPHICNRIKSQPVLFAFGSEKARNSFDSKFQSICGIIEKLEGSIANLRLCIFYDSSLVDFALKLNGIRKSGDQRYSHIDIADLRCPDKMWQTTEDHKSKFVYDLTPNQHIFGNFILPNNLEYYNCALYLGTRLPFELALEGPARMIKVLGFNEEHLRHEELNISRLLNRRMALVNRLRDEEELKIGVIITNPLPDIAESTKMLQSYANPRRHTLYFISMIQTIDECKIGNFDLCDAFVVINSCTCSTILESLVFNRPILTEHEFKMACGFEATYGRVLWPGSSSEPSEEDIINKRRISDVSLALVHTRNELLERCSQARLNRWSGMEFKKSVISSEGQEASMMDSLVIEKGLEGVASSYSKEKPG